MLEFIKFDIDLLKDEMKEAKVIRTTSSSAIEKRYQNKSGLQEMLRKNALFQFMYTPSKTLPVKVAGIMVNYKLYESFMKKLKGFQTKLVIAEDSLKLEYWRHGSSKATLELVDISHYFEGFKHIPVAEIQRDA
ncbi:hypothetical protein J7E79_02855 [Bacillus sp. ISL-40]|uniref:hypothetical protein n=1 Tax=unclassified Bacillus (in: firmicutes) TaxID=185979 RepID=UPI001BEBE059|nr:MULTISPECIES: hypothetical protein [unclassified Bacillus (in: firmicutes)]MBT2696376.1 hypothetical protein [Bacillus sp. ISL-40]MBT2743224.1 hypothetical protein [Bacillus sp. ISL-77]